jgi:hypothetical protein
VPFSSSATSTFASAAEPPRRSPRN